MTIEPAADAPLGAPHPPPGTLIRGSVMRFAADSSGVVLGTISSVVTARVLGPAGKGTLAALMFVTIFASQCCTLGLGDAAVVRIGQAKASAQEALSSSVVVVFLASLAGAAVVLAYALVQLPVGDSGVWAAVVIACLTVVAASVGQLLTFMVYARQRIIALSVLTIAVSVTTTVAVVVLCALLELGILGAALASLIAALLGLVVATAMLSREHLSLRPRRAAGYLRPALRFGLRTQLANVLAYSSARIDLLLVYALAGQHAAGQYSVALTVGTITGFVALALSYASFPRMAQMSDAKAFEMTADMARAGVILGTALAVVLGIAMPTLIPVLVGSEYSGAVAPGIVLLLANVLWGLQWLLSRSLAALGRPGLLVRSFSVNLVAMAAADLILVPAAGAVGAALGALIAAATGLVVCLVTYRHCGVPPSSFVPRRSDLRLLWERARRARRVRTG